jgi:hypothetical protein
LDKSDNPFEVALWLPGQKQLCISHSKTVAGFICACGVQLYFHTLEQLEVIEEQHQYCGFQEQPWQT